MKQVYVYSNGEYESLDKEFLEGKAIIRIHNVSNKNFYPHHIDNGLVLFFNDIKKSDLKLSEKFILNKTLLLSNLMLQLKYNGDKNKIDFFTYEQAKIITKFIYENKSKDFVIHCEFGKSRSMALAKFLNKYYDHNFGNRTVEDLKLVNDLVWEVLDKTYKAY